MMFDYPPVDQFAIEAAVKRIMQDLPNWREEKLHDVVSVAVDAATASLAGCGPFR